MDTIFSHPCIKKTGSDDIEFVINVTEIIWNMYEFVA